jgi:hypothetical protein
MISMHVALAVALCALPARVRDSNFTGTFETAPPEISAGLCGEGQSKLGAAAWATRQSVVITGEGVTLETAFGGIAMTYTLHGDYLLGKTVLGDGEMYYPIYVQDDNTVYLSGQKYVRVKA